MHAEWLGRVPVKGVNGSSGRRRVCVRRDPRSVVPLLIPACRRAAPCRRPPAACTPRSPWTPATATVPWAIGLAIWTWLILLNCGLVVSLVGLLVGGGYAAHLNRRRKAFGPEEGKQIALFGSTALRVVLLASGATAVLSVSGVLIGLISLGLGAWTFQRRSQFQGLQAELAEVESQIAAAQDERRNIDALTFEAVLKQQGITV
jgi:hypothetical protein